MRTPGCRRLPPERYLQRAREVAPEHHGEVSEERGARSGDIKDDGLHGHPPLGTHTTRGVRAGRPAGEVARVTGSGAPRVRI